MPLESSITKSILKYLNSLPGCIAEKTKGDSTSSGKPDINGCFRGRSFRIEVKTPDNKNAASKKQFHNLDKWQAAGAIVMLVYSLDFVKLVFTPKGIPSKYTFRGTVMAIEENGCCSIAKIPNLEKEIWC